MKKLCIASIVFGMLWGSVLYAQTGELRKLKYHHVKAELLNGWSLEGWLYDAAPDTLVLVQEHVGDLALLETQEDGKILIPGKAIHRIRIGEKGRVGVGVAAGAAMGGLLGLGMGIVGGTAAGGVTAVNNLATGSADDPDKDIAAGASLGLLFGAIAGGTVGGLIASKPRKVYWVNGDAGNYANIRAGLNRSYSLKEQLSIE